MVSHKDVVIACVGAAAGLVGFVLVFLGLLMTSYQALLATLGRPRLAGVRAAAWGALAVTAFGLLPIVLGAAWLVADGGSALYVSTLTTFFADLVALLAVAVVSTVILLR